MEDPARMVIVQKDGEGNDYSPLAGFWVGKYIPSSTWSGEMNDGLAEGAEGDKALVLYPVN